MARAGLTAENTIYGQSICPDEINNEKGDLATLMADHWGECFPMGGIGGAPFVGKTGFGAFSHHVPDDGHIIILFGPHIAISDSLAMADTAVKMAEEGVKAVVVLGVDFMSENVRAVLDAAGQKFGFKRNYTEFDFGGERYMRTNEALPDSAADDLRQFPSILLGAIGHPDVKPGILEKGILLRLRFELEQYINLRPVKLFDERFCPLKGKKAEDIMVM